MTEFKIGTQEKIVKGQERRALNLYVREEERVVERERERGEKKREREEEIRMIIYRKYAW